MGEVLEWYDPIERHGIVHRVLQEQAEANI
jgi:hypothetical protein